MKPKRKRHDRIRWKADGFWEDLRRLDEKGLLRWYPAKRTTFQNQLAVNKFFEKSFQ